MKATQRNTTTVLQKPIYTLGPGNQCVTSTSAHGFGMGRVTHFLFMELPQDSRRFVIAMADYKIGQSVASSPGFPLLGTKNELRRREAWSNSSHVRHFCYTSVTLPLLRLSGRARIKGRLPERTLMRPLMRARPSNGVTEV